MQYNENVPSPVDYPVYSGEKGLSLTLWYNPDQHFSQNAAAEVEQ